MKMFKMKNLVYVFDKVHSRDNEAYPLKEKS